MKQQIAVVAVAAPLDKALSYRVPEALRGTLAVGMRLRVPLGRRTAVGYLLQIVEGEADDLKDVFEGLDAEPLFSAAMVALFRRAADYYRHPLGEVIRTALPAGLSGGQGRLAPLRESVYRRAPDSPAVRGARQLELLAFLDACGQASRSELLARFPGCQGSLRSLLKHGLVLEDSQERLRDPFVGQVIPADTVVAPTEHQQQALTIIDSALEGGGFQSILLHGVTGSGKTEVYLRAIEKVLAAGRQALVLVPEIALTPQLVGRFQARFAPRRTRLAALHSGLSAGERYDAWRRIARGEVDIVIGARSAVFAPLERLGMLIVDEEHESSYKQSEGFRYHARDLALLRGQMEGAVVLLGSATPALTTWQRARSGLSLYVSLPQRVLERPLPEVILVDLTVERPDGLLARPLQEALAANLERGEQSLLLLNRRGFAPYLLCADCGTTPRCPHCDITLTYYLARRELRCHYCDYRCVPLEQCPTCFGTELLPEGAGTERLEQELQNLFPAARIARMDRDTTGRKGAHQDLVEGMLARRLDILLGTQMVAKGHDFPGVTLVGVLQTDNLLNLPDFRAAERAFTLLTQVAGRAGRGSQPGRVYIQSYAAGHYALECCVRHDFEGFCRQELALREELGYPPFGYLVNCVLTAADAALVGRTAEQIAAGLREPAGRLGVEVLGPAPCPLARLRGKSRFQVLLKSPQRPALRHLLGRLESLRRRLPSGVALAVDVDPLDMI
jgi:primosomal protein N' (replication factor Y)